MESKQLHKFKNNEVELEDMSKITGEDLELYYKVAQKINQEIKEGKIDLIPAEEVFNAK